LRSDGLETIFQRDIDRLPGLSDNEWLPRVRSRRRRFTLSGLSTLAALALMVVVVGLSIQAVRDAQPSVSEGAAAMPAFITTEPGAGALTSSTSIIASNPLMGAPSCPPGQLPWIDVAHPPPPGSVPGTGAASAAAAFRRARPSVTEFTMYPWGSNQPAQDDDPRIRGSVWIVAGSETYIAEAPGRPGDTNNWFAYPAKFMGCRTPPPAMRRTTPP
jgi:hypothetical protein